MYLQTSPYRYIRKKEIIGIFDFDTATVSGVTRTFLSGAEKNGCLENDGTDIPKSFLLLKETETGRSSVLISKLSASVLTARAEGREEDQT